ncbi:hypothetical protein F8M49_21165 [Rhodococcus zopfii]|uniref:Uncharacterized protein n=1 Tax=Rhodococcus zopfii TaxID=43772 RepID=A0ABU3WM99_9NOCA|nr:hypothetical protein [Rhodococcus zopfii]MDV2477231.1 hypothetical protein [Rhodococcus zopfii]
MSSLTRPLTDKELAAAGIEPAPIAHETFTQVFAVHDGELEVVAEDNDDAEDAPPASKRITPVVAIWCLTYSSAIGALIAAAVTR